MYTAYIPLTEYKSIIIHGGYGSVRVNLLKLFTLAVFT